MSRAEPLDEPGGEGLRLDLVDSSLRGVLSRRLLSPTNRPGSGGGEAPGSGGGEAPRRPGSGGKGGRPVAREVGDDSGDDVGDGSGGGVTRREPRDGSGCGEAVGSGGGAAAPIALWLLESWPLNGSSRGDSAENSSEVVEPERAEPETERPERTEPWPESRSASFSALSVSSSARWLFFCAALSCRSSESRRFLPITRGGASVGSGGGGGSLLPGSPVPAVSCGGGSTREEPKGRGIPRTLEAPASNASRSLAATC